MNAHKSYPRDPAFDRFESWAAPVPDGFFVNFLGVKTRRHFLDGISSEILESFFGSTLPPVNEEYFEWIDVLESVRRADQQFTMIELGAGYGRWLVNAAVALRRINPLPLKLIGVEAEPSHFGFMEQHFLDNGLDPRQHTLLRFAVNDVGGEVPFHIGNPSGWYGQAIAERQTGLFRRLIGALRYRWARLIDSRPGQTIVRVRAVTLNELLRVVRRVDLVDMDIQGAEARVISASMAELNAKVRRIHIGTHSCEIEGVLRNLFRAAGWSNVNDYACLSRNSTPYGEIDFVDGVQTWENLRGLDCD
jgi:FkbM family methyltransferase